MSRSRMLALAAVGATMACGTPSSPASGAGQLTGVAPSAEAVGVDVGSPVVLTFSAPMMTAMDSVVALHDGDLQGANVPGHFRWSATRDSLIFMPDSALMANHHYSVHVGGGMLDAMGDTVDLQFAHDSLGCSWATGSMMGSGGMMGGPGTEMGPGWRDARGTYGMAWSFTTS